MNHKNNMLALSQERFSARKFTPEAVSQEDLDYIMECVRLAPSAVNRQPWRWLIVRSEEAKKKLQDCYDREWFTRSHEPALHPGILPPWIRRTSLPVLLTCA